MDKALIIVIDGCNPLYITEEAAPNIHRLAREHGFAKTVECVLPSVTNVNHAAILSGEWPEKTGVVGNYWYDPKTGEEGFVEERGFMKVPTILQRYQAAGATTALLTVKGKVLGVYGDGATYGLSAQTPDEGLLKRWGLPTPPDIYSVEATRWIVEAALRCIEVDDPAFVYCTTNDFVFHHYAPGTPEAQQQITDVDELVAKIHEADPTRQIYLTADHSMNQKTTIANMQHVCDDNGFDTFCLGPLKDRYVANHIYQEGGMEYVYLKGESATPEGRERFRAFVEALPYVEQVLTAADAAAKYHLPADKIGDYVLFSAPGCAFGECDGETIHTDESRTHGSLYELEIPLIAINPAAPADEYHYHKDIVRHLHVA